MKIAIDCHTLEIKNWAGKEQYLIFTLQELFKLDENNKYVLYFRKKVFRDDFFPSNCEIKNFNFFTPFWQIRVIFDLFLSKVSLLFSPCTYLLPAMNFITPSIIIVYDLTTFLPGISDTHKIMTKLRERLVLKLAIKHSKKIIAISENTKKDLLTKFKIEPNRILIVYGAAHSRYKVIKDEDEISGRCKKYNIFEKFILSVGTLEPRKNIANLINAFHELINNYGIFDYKLVIVGKKGWYYDEIFNKVKELSLDNFIIFTGYVPDEDLPYLYNFASCFIYPSLYEGFGIPVAEAMACSCPVITSNISSLPEVAGDAAILINPYNIKEISGAIYKVLTDNNKGEEMKQKGLEQVKKFSWSKTASELLYLFNNLK